MTQLYLIRITSEIIFCVGLLSSQTKVCKQIWWSTY